MSTTRGWAVLAGAVLLFGLGGTAAAQGRPGCNGGGGSGSRGGPPQMSNQMGGGMGQSQMSRGGYQGQGNSQMLMQQQLFALQQQQLQANAMGDDLMASLVAADIRRYQDRMRQIQKQQQQQLNGGR